MKNNHRLLFASVVDISNIERSDLHITIKARLFETTEANLNGVRVTEKFLDDIVNNQERYLGLPLYADLRNLESKNFNKLGHLYNDSTGEFYSTQIGSFYKFEKEQNCDNSALIGYARIPKRNKNIYTSIVQLFADNLLKFSFEISCGEYEELQDGTIVIDASKDNYLEGIAIVANPACENAVALQLVAQKNNTTDNSTNNINSTKREDVTQMPSNETSTIIDNSNITADSVSAHCTTADCIVSTKTIAENVEQPSLKEENSDSCKKTYSEEIDSSCNKKPYAEEENAACGKKSKPCGEEENAACNKKPCGEEENAACGKKSCGEEELSSIINSFAEVVKSISEIINSNKIISEKLDKVIASSEANNLSNPVVAYRIAEDLSIKKDNFISEMLKSDESDYSIEDLLK